MYVHAQRPTNSTHTYLTVWSLHAQMYCHLFNMLNLPIQIVTSLVQNVESTHSNCNVTCSNVASTHSTCEEYKINVEPTHNYTYVRTSRLRAVSASRHRTPHPLTCGTPRS